MKVQPCNLVGGRYRVARTRYESDPLRDQIRSVKATECECWVLSPELAADSALARALVSDSVDGAGRVGPLGCAAALHCSPTLCFGGAIPFA